MQANQKIVTYRESMDEHAREYLTRVLTATGGDRISAAQMSGLNRTHLQALIKRHDVQVAPNFKNRGRRKGKAESGELPPESASEATVNEAGEAETSRRSLHV